MIADCGSTIQKHEASQSQQHGMGQDVSASTDPTSEDLKNQTHELDAKEFVLQCWARNPAARKRRQIGETVFRQGVENWQTGISSYVQNPAKLVCCVSAFSSPVSTI